MNEIAKEKLMTTKELAEVLSVHTDTINSTVKKLDGVLRSVKKNNQGGYLFNEEQATQIKQEIQKHHNLQNRQIDNVKTEIELIENYKKSTDNLIQYLNQKKTELEIENQMQKEKLIEQAPKVALYNTSMQAENTYSMNEVAKILNLPYGNKTLFSFLRENKILDKNNIPYEKFIKKDFFKVIIKPVKIGSKIENKTVTRVTQKGTNYILRLLRKKA